MSTIQLWTKHRGLARLISRDFRIPGCEEQDVIQEAEIGLWIAARDYDPEIGEFKTWANVVVRRRLQDCLTRARRGKAMALSTAVREVVLGDGSRDQIVNTLPHLHQITDRCEEIEEIREVLTLIRTKLTEAERYAVLGLASGLSYWEMGQPKAIDNAIQRARLKLRAA